MAAPFRPGLLATRTIYRAATRSYLDQHGQCLAWHRPSSILFCYGMRRQQRSVWASPVSVTSAQCIHTSAQYYTKIGTTVKGTRLPTIKAGDIVNLLGSENENLGSMKRKEAEKIAEEKSLKLVIVDPNSQPYPTLRILSGKQLAGEQKRERKFRKDSKPKETKLIHIKTVITDHDLTIKTAHMIQWLEKGHDVKVAIKNRNPSDAQTMSSLFKSITDSASSSATVQKAKHTDSELRFTLKSLTTETEEDGDGSSVQKPLKVEELKGNLSK